MNILAVNPLYSLSKAFPKQESLLSETELFNANMIRWLYKVDRIERKALISQVKEHFVATKTLTTGTMQTNLRFGFFIFAGTL